MESQHPRVLKVKRNKLNSKVFANSARVRCAIYSRDTAIRISSVSSAKIRLSKSRHGPKIWALPNNFAGLPNIGFSKFGHILGKTHCSGPRRRPGRQASGGTGLAPRQHVWGLRDFLGLINTSGTSLVRNNERYLAFYPAVTPAVSRDVRSAAPIFS